MGKIFKLLTALLIAGSLLSPAALAKSDNARESLVALGDSIPFGLNLGQNNQHPSKYGYPSIIGDEADLRVRNLAVPGDQTEDLLSDLQNSQKYRQAVKHADYVTLSVISNDLLEILRNAAATGKLGELQFLINEDDVAENLLAIITEIRELTDAPIILYNVYNPFQQSDGRYQIAETALPFVNAQLALLADSFEDVYIADAYSAFSGNEAAYILPSPDIHPTELGQEVLADLALEVLDELE